MKPLLTDHTKLPRTLRFHPKGRAQHKLQELSLSQLQKLADEFDLGRIVQMDEPLSTQCNLTDPFRTGQGIFMLRARHGEEFGDRVDFLHSVIGFLHSRGFPAPEVMHTRKGRSWTLWGDRLVEVQRFIPHDVGTHRDWSRMNAAASSLGEMHRLLHDLPNRKGFVPPEMRNDLSPMECWELADTVEARVRAQPDATPGEIAAAEAVLATLRRLLPPLVDNYDRIVGILPWSVVHGDYHPWNLLYRGDAVAGVVDYDFLQERERLFDVAYGMRSLMANLQFPPGKDPFNYSSLPWWKIQLWLDQYDEASYMPLSNLERGYLPGELLRLQLVEIIASGLQDPAVEGVLTAASGLPLYEWVHNQSILFI